LRLLARGLTSTYTLIVVEAKFCATSGGSIVRRLLPKLVNTVERLVAERVIDVNQLQEVYFILAIPQEAAGAGLSSYCDKLARYMVPLLRELGVEVDRGDVMCLAVLKFPNSVVIHIRGHKLRVEIANRPVVVNIFIAVV